MCELIIFILPKGRVQNSLYWDRREVCTRLVTLHISAALWEKAWSHYYCLDHSNMDISVSFCRIADRIRFRISDAKGQQIGFRCIIIIDRLRVFCTAPRCITRGQFFSAPWVDGEFTGKQCFRTKESSNRDSMGSTYTSSYRRRQHCIGIYD